MDVEIIFSNECKGGDTIHACIKSLFWDEIDFSGVNFRKGSAQYQYDPNTIPEPESIIPIDQQTSQQLFDTINMRWSADFWYFTIVLLDESKKDAFYQKFQQWAGHGELSDDDDDGPDDDSDRSDISDISEPSELSDTSEMSDISDFDDDEIRPMVPSFPNVTQVAPAAEKYGGGCGCGSSGWGYDKKYNGYGGRRYDRYDRYNGGSRRTW